MPNESKVREADGLYGYDETGRMISFTLESENRRTNIPPSECLSEEELRRLGEEYLKTRFPLINMFLAEFRITHLGSKWSSTMKRR